MEKLIDLPTGYYVKEDACVGYSYYNEKGKIILQHPYDNNNARALVWHLYKTIYQE